MSAVSDCPNPRLVPAPGELPDLGEATDDAGVPRADLLPDSPAWFRSVAGGSAEKKRLRGTVRALTALSDRRGLPAFVPDEKRNRLADDLAAAAKTAGMKKGGAVRRTLRATADRANPVPDDWDADDAPGFQSDFAAVGLLRSHWGRKSDALALAWPPGTAAEGGPARTNPVALELRAFGRRLLCGAWGISLTIDGEPVDVGDDGWACVCSHADFDGGYLELQWTGESAAGPVRVERQAFLSRHDRFAALSDSVSLTGADRDESARIEHAAALPLAGTGPKRVTAGVDRSTREARLFGGDPDRPRQRARVFPLALPQERVESADGAIELPADGAADAGELSRGWLTVRSAAAGGLVSPVVLDWGPDREEKRADWRSLTVTEDRRRLTSARAAAHRLRIGRKHQLLLYRRTDDCDEARAVLGHHHDRETLIAGFDRRGEVGPLLVV